MKQESPAPPLPQASPDLAEARHRIPLNVLSNAAWLVLNALVNIWYIPFLIDRLGVAAYGLIPLTASLTKYLTVVTDGFNSSVSRYLTIDLSRGDTTAANRTFNTALATSLLLAAVLTPIALLIAFFAPQVFNTPAGLENSTRLLILLTLFAFVATTVASSFAVSSFAYHRFDLRFVVNAVRLLAEIAIVVAFFFFLSPQLWIVGLGIFVASLLYFVGNQAVWRKLTPQLSVDLRGATRRKMRALLGFSGWVLINQVGSLLFLNIDLLVANLIFGAVVGGRYGAVIIFPTLLRTFATTFNSVLTPIILTLYGRERQEALAVFSQQAVKFMGLIMALPIGLLCGLAAPLLTTWLGPDFTDLAPLVFFLTAHLCINVAVLPLFAVQIATGRVAVPGIVSLIMGVLNLLLALALASWTGWGAISIAIAGAIALSFKNALFTTLYGAHILDLPWWTFLRSIIPGILGFLVVLLATYFLTARYDLVGWLRLALVSGLISLVYLPLAYVVGLTRQEKTMLRTELRKRTGVELP